MISALGGRKNSRFRESILIQREDHKALIYKIIESPAALECFALDPLSDSYLDRAQPQPSIN